MKTGKFKTHLISVGICITQFLFYKDLFFCSLSKVYHFLLKSSREFHMVNVTIAIQLIWFAFLMPDSEHFWSCFIQECLKANFIFFLIVEFPVEFHEVKKKMWLRLKERSLLYQWVFSFCEPMCFGFDTYM